MPESVHPLPPLPRGGWKGIPFAELDGKSWTLPFAAVILDIPVEDLRALIRVTGLQPSGVINMRDYRSQGRAARAYDAKSLIMIAEDIASLKEKLR
jgi:hypothetical protein